MPSTANAVTRARVSGRQKTNRQISIGTMPTTMSALIGTACRSESCDSHRLPGSIRSRPKE
jgi:hypothetical protein